MRPSCEVLQGRQLLAVAVGGGLPAAPAVFFEPQAGRNPLIRAIDAAKSSIRLGICNISDPEVGDALAAAETRGVRVRVIVDRADYLAKAPEQAEVDGLLRRGVSVHLSNPVFPQSFEKELVIDRRRVLIMTLCIVPATFEDTRDMGLVLADGPILREVSSVFDADWAASAPPGQPAPPFNPTPRLRVANLIWGPADATSKLSRLIGTASRTIDATSELLGDPYLEGQLVAAAHRGVRVRMICPVDTRAGTSNAADIALLEGQGIEVRVTPDPNPPAGALPYMHAKTMIVDGRTAYVGSVDLETTAATQSRELGILARRKGLVARIARQFHEDWSAAPRFVTGT